MKELKYINLVLLGLILAMSFSCREDETIIDTTETPFDGTDGISGVNEIWGITEISGDIIGQVFEVDGQPIENAEVSVSDNTTTTDVNGIFVFKNLSMNSNGTLISVKSPEHFDYTKIIEPQDGRQSNVDFAMHRKGIPTVFNTSTGANVNHSSQGFLTEVDLPAGAYTFEESSTLYEGDVEAYLTWIDPTNDEHQRGIPGNLRALDIEGNQVQLASFSMIALELYTPEGDKLNLTDGQEAMVRFPIPSSLRQVAPASIPLWSYQDESGDWIGESFANREGDFYVGEVNHFSWWNCDAPFPLVNIKGRVVDSEGKPNPNIPIIISLENSGIGRQGYTDSDGYFCAKVPKSENLILSIKNNFFCRDISQEYDLGAFETDMNIGTLTFDLLNVVFNGLSGTLLSCDGMPTKEGYLWIEETSTGEGRRIGVDQEGNFDFDVPLCWESFTLTGYDLTVGFVSDPLEFPNGLSADQNIGEYLLCTEIESFIEFEILGESYRIEDVFASRPFIASTLLIHPSADSLFLNPDASFFLFGEIGDFEMLGEQSLSNVELTIPDGSDSR